MPSMPGEPVLPLQAPQSLQEKIYQVQQQQALLAQMRATGDSRLIQQADALQEQYHVRDVGALTKDVYRSAAHEDAPPGLGWIRVSEHPELLKERLGVDWTKQQIHEYLQPDNSDFRAEIYLPDPRVYGPDVKPVISYKGSNGPVAVPDGKGGFQLRESALEDWIENARQGIGLESDHFDRSMKLAITFKHDFDGLFENAGHSKGGGQATAAAAVTGMSTYLYNSSGLHPRTPERYAAQHNLTVFDAEKSIHSYHVNGEILNAAQTGIHDMDSWTRAQVGLAARQLGELSQLTDVRELTRDHLAQALPYDPQMQRDALGLMDYLGSHSGKEILKGVPVAAGATQIELPAKMRDACGNLVDRPQQPSLGEVGADAGPLMNVVSGALAGGVVGKRVGDVVATGGRGVEQGTQWMGAGAQKGFEVYGYVLNNSVQGSGQLVAGTMHYGGAAAADMRVVTGQVHAAVDLGMGTLAQWNNVVNGAVLRAGSHLPYMDGLKQVAERWDRATATYVENQQAQAAHHIVGAYQDAGAIRDWADDGATAVRNSATMAGQALQHDAHQVGRAVNEGYRNVGSSVREVTGKAPEGGAVLGMSAGSALVGVSYLRTVNLPAAMQSYNVLSNGKSAVTEALGRHAAEEVVLPSLDARTRLMEDGAVKLMHELRQPQKPVTPGDNPSAFLQGMLDSAKTGDWAAFRNDTQTLANMQPGRELHANAAATVDRQEQYAWNQQMLAQQQAAQQQVSQPFVAAGMSR